METIKKFRFITAEKVSNAVKQLQDENKKVTCIAVRNILGGGSYNDINIELSKLDKTKYINKEDNIDPIVKMHIFINEYINELFNKSTSYLVDELENLRYNCRSLAEELDDKLLYISCIENNSKELENQVSILNNKINNDDKIINDIQLELNTYKNIVLNNRLIEQDMLKLLNEMKENIHKDLAEIIINNSNN
jgi:hypothetical protein